MTISPLCRERTVPAGKLCAKKKGDMTQSYVTLTTLIWHKEESGSGPQTHTPDNNF